MDQDGSQQIEFDEFLSIIKGGNSKSSTKQSAQAQGSPDKKKGASKEEILAQESGSSAIFEFFKKLTSGELKVDSDDKIIPFSIFISTYRRKKILAAMMCNAEDGEKERKKKEEGTRILNNYKKQLAEKLARQKAEQGDTMSTTTYS